MVDYGSAAPGLDALARLRRASRSGRRAGTSRSDTVYRAYVATLLGLFGFYLALGLVDDLPIDAAATERVASRGPAWVGTVAALSVAVGLRSGARGGPLAIDELEMHHVLLSPIDRGFVLRGSLRRLTLIAVVFATIVGAAAGELASRRLPGLQGQWVASGALSSIGIVLVGLGAAAVAAGCRLRPAVAATISVALVGWQTAAVWASVPSPFDGFGQLALWPLRHQPVAMVGVVAPVLVLWFGRWSIGALSIEQAHRRARLVAQVRFALAQQDIRSLLLLRRQLAQEAPRSRPWVDIGSNGGFGQRFPVLVRDARSYARWPLARILRVAGLAVVAGVAIAGMWAGTTALMGVTGGAIYLAAIEAVEPFSQELDHPALLGSLPMAQGPIMLWHLVSATLAMSVVWVLAGVTAMIATVSLTPGLAVAIAAPAAAAAAAVAGALSIRRIDSGTQVLMTPDELAGPQVLFRLLWPPALAMLGVMPVLSARGALARGTPVVPATVGTMSLVGFVAVLAASWIRFRDELAGAAARQDGVGS